MPQKVSFIGFLKQNLTLTAFILPAIYWVYLLCATHIELKHDAIAYERLGQLIYQKGWAGFFTNGPNREALYPFIISISMRVADWLGVSYQVIQRILQMGILLSTQLLVYKLLNRLGVRKTIAALTLFYIGFSPSLVNSAFSLFSEIVTYPLMLGTVLLTAGAWRLIQSEARMERIILSAATLAFTGVLMTLAKGIFEYILSLVLVPFAILTIGAVLRKDKTVALNSLVYLAVTGLIFYVSLYGYKSLNEKYNGNFTLTDRGSWALYGNTARRLDPAALKKIPAALAYAAGEGACQSLLSKEDCAFWGYELSDRMGAAKRQEFEARNTSPHEVDSSLIAASKQAILQNPPQYFLFYGIENLKMFFWESTKIGFVHYPEWLGRLFDFNPFKNGLRLIVFLITICSFFYLLFVIWTDRKKLLDNSTRNHEPAQIIFFMLITIIFFIGIYSFFFILTRYALPIAPLFIAGIAYSVERIISLKASR